MPFPIDNEHTQELSYKTASIKNIDYVVANDWGEIPINEVTGEDINSEVFYIKSQRKSLKRGVIENRISIAKNWMELKVDFLNNTQRNFRLESIKLEVKRIHDLGKIDFETGEWTVDIGRGYWFERSFNIDAKPNSYVIVENEKTVLPKGERDPRIKFSVSAAETPSRKNVVLQFAIKLTVTSTGVNSRTYEVTSDKDYFIAIL